MSVVTLPDQLFYNTGISTYFWVVTNRKAPERRGKVQLVDAREQWVKMRKSLGDKRKQISPDQIADITRLYAENTEGDQVKVFPNEAFGYQRITVERPLRRRWEITDDTLALVAQAKPVTKMPPDASQALLEALRGHLGTSESDRALAAKAIDPILAEHGLTGPQAKAVWAALAVADPDAPVIVDRRGNPEPDPDLRDNENVPLPETQVTFDADPTDRLATPAFRQAVDDYVTAEVLPYVPDAWVDHTRTKLGYEIPLTRHFYTYTPPRPLAEIDAEIKQLEAEIQDLLREVTE